MNTAGVLSLSVVAAVVASSATTFGILRLSRPDAAADVAMTTVPPVEGLSEDDARHNLAARHLAMLIDSREPTGEVAPGHVIAQSVPAGSSQPRGKAVSVTLAAPLHTVPALTGLGIDRARAVVEKAGYRLELGAPVAAAGVRAGRVARQTPEVDTPLEPKGTVTIQVAKPHTGVAPSSDTGLKTPWETSSARALTR
jgi:beta-lactam-binding protein with PASTA domain